MSPYRHLIAMSLERELLAFSPTRPTVLTVGNFDGVHIGHQALLQRLAEASREAELLPGVITFREHPLSLLSPGNAPLRLASVKDNIDLIKSLGVEQVIPLTFDTALAKMGARDFALLLKDRLDMKGLILGWDFAMGHRRSGTLSALADLGQELEFTTEVVPAITLEGEVVSSSAIRRALADGNIGKANAMLGRPFHLTGPITHGAGRGAQLGFPTANLNINPDQAMPADGVYATMVHIGDRTYPSVTAISPCPTFDGTQRTVEIHLLDFTGNLYHQELRLDIIEHLRTVHRFENAEALCDQIGRDVTQARELLRVGEIKSAQ